MMTDLTIEYHDEEPDELGRRHFTLTWSNPEGVFVRDEAPDGKPVGYRRAQCFRCDPKTWTARARVVRP